MEYENGCDEGVAMQAVGNGPNPLYVAPIPERLRAKGWFSDYGAYVLVDGQFGSTGKGLAEQCLALMFGSRVTHVTTNAGPNSGHTTYDHDTGGKIITKQIPSFSTTLARLNRQPQLILNAGALVDPDILLAELRAFPGIRLQVHPHAAAILPEHKEAPISSILQVASTNKGTGPALAAKVLREKFAVVEHRHEFRRIPQSAANWNWDRHCVFVSTAQGFSLGLNSGFYPYTTCRECTVQQALADASIPARRLRKVIATYRTYPIRVGNTQAGSSGPGYPDQIELDWATLGVEPETTTVTGRVRRVFTWSDIQFTQSIQANEPDAFFLNFINYFKTVHEAQSFVVRVWELYKSVRGGDPDFIMLGFGPRHSDVACVLTKEEAMMAIAERMGK